MGEEATVSVALGEEAEGQFTEVIDWSDCMGLFTSYRQQIGTWSHQSFGSINFHELLPPAHPVSQPNAG